MARNDQSLSWVRKTLGELSIHPQKRWGQNYLINAGAREKIVHLLDPQSTDRVWEIGPGLGAITDLLVPAVGGLVLFEIDWALVHFLAERYRSEVGVRIVPGDVLGCWAEEAGVRGRPDKIVGNLPYGSASAIIASFVEGGLAPCRMLFTVQRELAERMTSEPGRKEYSSFSVLCQSAYRQRVHGGLSPGSFYPAPRVASTVIELRPRTERVRGPRRRLLSTVVQGLFESRRKTLKNNLLSSRRFDGCDRNALLRQLREMDIDPQRRAETLTPEVFVRMAEAFAPYFPV